MAEIKYALMEASRGVQRYLSGKRKAHEIATKRKVISRYVKQLASDLSSLSGKKPEKIEKQLAVIIEKKYGEIESREEKEKLVLPEEEGGEE